MIQLHPPRQSPLRESPKLGDDELIELRDISQLPRYPILERETYFFRYEVHCDDNADDEVGMPSIE